MKTGFTQSSGFNLIATAHRNDKRLLAVVLGGVSAGSRNAAMRNILDNAWSKAMTLTAVRKAGVLGGGGGKPDPAWAAKASPKPAESRGACAGRDRGDCGQASAGSCSCPGPFPSLSACAGVPGAYSRLKRRPDQASISMLLHAIEAGLVRSPARSPTRNRPRLPIQRQTSPRIRPSKTPAVALPTWLLRPTKLSAPKRLPP